MTDADPTVLVARADGDDVGYLIAYDRFGDGSYYVWMPGVVPAFRREGIMSALLDRVTVIAAEQVYDELKIKTRNGRRAMRHLLVGEGFDVCGFDPVGDLERHEIMHVRDL
ncbi:MAG: GNAT family N-acetyltransferase [Candidatus Nanohaloarchaea archaeon]